VTKHRPLIGVVDSGIDSETTFAAARSFRFASGRILEGVASIDTLGHATNTIRLIRDGAPQARFAIAQVFFDSASSPEAIAVAVDWLVGLNAQLINLSLGTPRHSYPLHDACTRAHAAGCLLVASVPSRGTIVYPAAYPGVIRVTGDARCQSGQFSRINSERCDLGASPLPHPQCTSSRLLAGGASCATARVSAVLAALLQSGCAPAQCVAQFAAQCAFHGPQSARTAATFRADGSAQGQSGATD
jgi:hypothetical protein